MNTDHLASMYGRLSPRERLPLIIAAGARGDSLEQKRLVESAPKQTFQVPDHYPLSKAFQEAADYHLLTLLDLAASFWLWWALWLTYPRRAKTTPGAKQAGHKGASDYRLKEWRAGSMVRYFAFRFVSHVDGWKKFCADLEIDSEVMLSFMIGWDNVRRTEARARDLAFDPEEAARFLLLETVPDEGGEPLKRPRIPVERVDELARGWHTFLEDLRRQEGGA